MSHRRRNRSFRRMALALAVVSVICAGGVSAAPQRSEQLVDEASNDPYLTDVYLRPGESLGGPDGGPVVMSRALGSQVADTETDAKPDDERLRVEHALEAQAQGGLSGYLVDVAAALVAPAASVHNRKDSPAHDEQVANEHAREAQAQGGLSGYLKNEQVWAGRE